jgi:hypothetical protein
MPVGDLSAVIRQFSGAIAPQIAAAKWHANAEILPLRGFVPCCSVPRWVDNAA